MVLVLASGGNIDTGGLHMGRLVIQWVALFTALIIVTASSQGRTPGPKIKPSISPQDYSNYRYHNHISNDFSESDRFDLKNPIEIEVEIQRIYLHEDGYVELFYTLPGDENLRLPKGMDPDTPIAQFRRATLQTADEFKRLKIKEHEFKKGATAILSGWPALEIQMPYSEMLVDEITYADGKTYVLHQESEKMVKYKDKDKPRKNNNEQSPDETPPDSEAGDG